MVQKELDGKITLSRNLQKVPANLVAVQGRRIPGIRNKETGVGLEHPKNSQEAKYELVE